MNKEAFANNDRLAQDLRKIEGLKEENARLKSGLSKVKDDNEKLIQDLHSFQSRESKNESQIVDLKKQVMHMQDKVKFAEKQKSDLEAELEAERNICQTKKNALQMTTDEISNSNQMINNLNKEVLKLKSKVELRTEIAMRQEKLIQDKEKEISKLKDLINTIQTEHIKNRAANEEYAQTVKRLKDSLDTIEDKYRRKINEMIMRQQSNDKISIISQNLNPVNRYLKPQNRINN
jgi:spindle assembly abnormal protein 6